ncbi:MAG: hypothetical protein Q8K11_01140 [Phenylobacterium sp.]|uniref:hypothetical protein n=1 Tax=Phenylobacterium sp. TaxID=1871053 RepID=UPI002730222F|nr:hypothetical protein [Phenylobacterium sp.]MDP2008757.1 hypothetical protein [Phenylobacterium sp.]MDP3867150.1 hypothetical protein [Phenylobacterium sp.]
MKILLIGASAAMIAGAATAQTPETVNDLRCMVSYAFVVGTSKDQTAITGPALGMFYYQGRIDGREPSLPISSIFTKLALSMTAEEVENELPRCNALVREKAIQMQVIGKEMQGEAKS